MKLYTEEQVKRAMLHSYLSGVERPADYLPIEESILNSLTPIEIPSDEEIEIESPIVNLNAHDYYFGHKDGFIEGAKWVIEHIKK